MKYVYNAWGNRHILSHIHRLCIDELRTKLDCDRIIELSFKRSIECIKCHLPLRDENLGSKLYAK